VFQYGFTVLEDGTLLVSCCPGFETTCHLLQPVGPFSDASQAMLLEAARALPYPLRIVAVSEDFLAGHAHFASHFEAVAVRDMANYVYAASDLAHLRGRRYAAKRNLIAQARRSYEWVVEPLAPEHREACLAVADDIAGKRSLASGVTLEREAIALRRALDLQEQLALGGVVIRTQGRVAAFSIFDKLNPTTADVLFERALRAYKGLYQVVNQETAQRLLALGYERINREEDLGDPGLREAKLSYHPVRLEPSFELTFRKELAEAGSQPQPAL